MDKRTNVKLQFLTTVKFIGSPVQIEREIDVVYESSSLTDHIQANLCIK